MKFPEFRTGIHAIWQACLRIGWTPPGLPGSQWDQCTASQQALVMGFNQVETHDGDVMEAKLHGMEIQN